LSFGPGRTQHGLLLGGLIAGLAVLVLALLPVRREVELRPDALPPLPGRWWRAAPVALGGGLLIGPVGLVSAGTALALPRRGWAAGAGWVQAVDQGLAAVALCLVTAALVDWTPPAAPTRGSAADLPGAPAAQDVGQPQRRPLDQHPGQAAESGRAERGERRDRSPAEVGPAGDPVDRIEHEQVPQEDPVRPSAEQP